MSQKSRVLAGAALRRNAPLFGCVPLVRAAFVLVVSSLSGAGATGCSDSSRTAIASAPDAARATLAPGAGVDGEAGAMNQGATAAVAPSTGIDGAASEATNDAVPLAPGAEPVAAGSEEAANEAGSERASEPTPAAMPATETPVPEAPVPEAPVPETLQLSNPLILQRADAQIVHHSDGSYVFAATVPEYDRIELRRAETLAGLQNAPGVVVWTRHTTGVMAAHIWAPEIHFIDGRWYIYFAAGSSTDIWAIRIYVLENASENPLEGTWTERGQLVTNFESFALDATTFEHAGTRYLVWAQSDPSIPNNSSIFIGEMANPWTLAGPGVRLSRPEFEWETRGFLVNEGPAVLVRNGRVFITYSASATDANYCMGLLTASDSSDLMNPGSWSKSPTPIFTSTGSVFGPGHNQFTTSPGGTIDLLVYHGRDYRDIVGDPLDDPNRHTRIQPFTWNEDGTPNFGRPVDSGPLFIEAARE